MVAKELTVVAGAPLLRVSGVSKSFSGAPVLDNVSFEVRSGEVVAIVGHNGSGKSTLVKILARIHSPDPGARIEVANERGELLPLRATHHRLHFIHQDLGLLPMLSTTENLDLGGSLGWRWVLPVRRNEEDRRAAESVARFGAAIDVRAPVGSLSPAERAIVAIARALGGWDRPGNVLVLDEPTTAFHREEVARLFEAIRRVVSAGAGVVFISHRLDEVRDIADRVIILRDGQKVADGAVSGFDDDRLIRAIVGGSVEARRPGPPQGEAGPALTVRGLRGQRLRSFDLQVRSGEIVGVTGVLGSGREELAGMLFGERPPLAGSIAVDGRPIRPGQPAAAIARGMAYVPADRLRLGALAAMSATENLTLASLGSLRRQLGRVDRRMERVEARRWSAAVGLHPPRPERRLSTFSGGNQQKIVLARWLRTDPRVLILDEPTQGVDVGAKATIHDLVAAQARSGTAVLVVSSDAKELASICHRVVVLDAGRAALELAGPDLTEAALVRETLTAGVAGGSR
ncbi:MAG TPA: sugar ABC transporter ATP-binding protein [Acidimicrobiales bacterium]|nr:sugar ABC transporter ATP-binding protein [Acidimicrobiales bacterium]